MGSSETKEETSYLPLETLDPDVEIILPRYKCLQPREFIFEASPDVIARLKKFDEKQRGDPEKYFYLILEKDSRIDLSWQEGGAVQESRTIGRTKLWRIPVQYSRKKGDSPMSFLFDDEKVRLDVWTIDRWNTVKDRFTVQWYEDKFTLTSPDPKHS